MKDKAEDETEGRVSSSLAFIFVLSQVQDTVEGLIATLSRQGLRTTRRRAGPQPRRQASLRRSLRGALPPATDRPRGGGDAAAVHAEYFQSPTRVGDGRAPRSCGEFPARILPAPPAAVAGPTRDGTTEGNETATASHPVSSPLAAVRQPPGRVRLAAGLTSARARPQSESTAHQRVLGVGADTIQSMGGDEDELKVIEQSDDEMDLTSATNAAHDASIIKFVNQVMAEALELRATDVHVEPFENELRVRYRVDGVLVEANVPRSRQSTLRSSPHQILSLWTSREAPPAD